MAPTYRMKLYERNKSLDHSAIGKSLTSAFSLQTEDDCCSHDREANLLVTVMIDLDENDSDDRWELAERKALGFSHAGVSIGFRLQGNYDEVTREMIRMVNWVLERYSGDATFYNVEYDTPRLFRSRGKIVLVDEEEFWSCDSVLRTLITLPYENRKASVYFDLTVFSEKRKLHPMAVGNMFIAKFGMLLHPHDAPRRIGEGLIATPYRFDDKRPHDFSKPHDHGENLGINFEVDVLSYDAGLAKLVAITRWVLEQYDGDATLEWRPQWNATEPPLLTRTNNTVTLSDEPDFWTPERKAIMLGKPLS